VRVMEADLLVWIQKKKNNPSQMMFLIDNLPIKKMNLVFGKLQMVVCYWVFSIWFSTSYWVKG
jgi:hypothetical protein